MSSLVDSLGGAVEGLSSAVGQASGAFTDSVAERVTSLINDLQVAQEWGFSAEDVAEAPGLDCSVAHSTLQSKLGADHITPGSPQHDTGVSKGGRSSRQDSGQDSDHCKGDLWVTPGATDGSTAEAAGPRRMGRTPEGGRHGDPQAPLRGRASPAPSAALRAQGHAGGQAKGDRGTWIKHFSDCGAAEMGPTRSRGGSRFQKVLDEGEALASRCPGRSPPSGLSCSCLASAGRVSAFFWMCLLLSPILYCPSLTFSLHCFHCRPFSLASHSGHGLRSICLELL